MKKLLFSVLCITFTFSLFYAQESVEVDYELSMDLDPDEIINNIPSQQRAYVEDQIRQEIADGIFMDYKLKTNGEKSVYQLQPKLNNAQGGAGLIATQMMSQDKSAFYKDLKTQTFSKEYSIMGTVYNVVDSLPSYEWTISREKDNIAGFDVRKATGVYNDSITATAWFTPKISIKDGPDRVWGLPGLILKTEFEINKTTVTLTAKNVAVKEEDIKIEQPKKGKTLTQKEFEEEMKKLQEKMKEMYGGGVDTSD